MKKFVVSLMVIAGVFGLFGGVISAAEKSPKGPIVQQNNDGGGW